MLLYNYVCYFILTRYTSERTEIIFTNMATLVDTLYYVKIAAL